MPRAKEILMELKYKEKLYSRVIEDFSRKESRMGFIFRYAGTVEEIHKFKPFILNLFLSLCFISI